MFFLEELRSSINFFYVLKSAKKPYHVTLELKKYEIVVQK